MNLSLSLYTATVTYFFYLEYFGASYLLFFQDPLVTNHRLQVMMCQPLWHGDVTHLLWSVPPHFQPLSLPVLPPTILSPLVKVPSVCCGPLYLYVCLLFLLFVQVFPSLFFPSPTGDLVPGGWAPVLTISLMKPSVAHTAKHNRLLFICTATAPDACDAIIPLRYIARIICLLSNYLIFGMVYTFTWFKFQ